LNGAFDDFIVCKQEKSGGDRSAPSDHHINNHHNNNNNMQSVVSSSTAEKFFDQPTSSSDDLTFEVTLPLIKLDDSQSTNEDSRISGNEDGSLKKSPEKLVPDLADYEKLCTLGEFYFSVK